MNSRAPLLGLFLLVGSAPAAAQVVAEPGTKVSVLPVDASEGVDARTLKAVEGLLPKKLKAKPLGLKPVASKKTARSLALTRKLEPACAEVSTGCAVKVARLDETAAVLVPRLRMEAGAPGGPAGPAVLDLALVDVEAGRELCRLERPLPGGKDKKALGAAVEDLLLTLVTGKGTGSLVVTGAPGGAQVVLDGVVRGQAPLPGPLLRLNPGAATLVLSLDGFVERTLPVEIPLDGSLTVDGALEPLPPPPVAAAPETASAEATPSAPAPVADAAETAGPDGAPREAAPPEARLLRLAVYPFEVSGVDARLGRLVTDAVVQELRKLQGISVIGMDEIQAMLDLEAEKMMMGCESDENCMAEIADALGVDGIVIGTLARLENEHIFGLKRIDQRAAKTVGSVNHRLEPQGGQEFFAVIGPSIEEVFPELPLRPGEERGVDEEILALLSPPPIPTWAFYTGAGVTGALGAAFAGAALAYGGAQLDHYLAGQAARTQLTPATQIKTKELVVWVTYGAMVAAGAVTFLAGSALGVSAFWVDWWGYGERAEALGAAGSE